MTEGEGAKGVIGSLGERVGRFGTVWDGNETVLGRNWGFGVAFLG